MELRGRGDLGKLENQNKLGRCFSENLLPRPSIDLLLLCFLILRSLYMFMPSKRVFIP